MQAPKRKTSKSKRNMRRSHHALKAVQVISCNHCDEPMVPHRVCPSCGFYRGKSYIAKIDTAAEEV